MIFVAPTILPQSIFSYLADFDNFRIKKCCAPGLGGGTIYIPVYFSPYLGELDAERGTVVFRGEYSLNALIAMTPLMVPSDERCSISVSDFSHLSSVCIAQHFIDTGHLISACRSK